MFYLPTSNTTCTKQITLPTPWSRGEFKLYRYITYSLLWNNYTFPSINSSLKMGETIVDYYEVLQCDKTATTSELKKNYQCLLLSTHPDKSDGTDEKFILIQKAWSILKEPESRKQYDAILTCHEHSEILLYDTVLLSDMTFVEDGEFYTYSCRCGGTYLLEKSEPMLNIVYIGCDECSFSIQVKR